MKLRSTAMGVPVLALALAMVWPGTAGATLLKVGLMEEPKTLNVFGAKDIWASKVLLFSYQRLYYRDPSGHELIPWLASGEAQWDPGSNTVTFGLREAKWDDGTPFTAHDVVFTAELIRRFRIPAYWNNWSFVDKVEAPDERTVRLVLKKPMAILWARTLTSIVVQRDRWKPIVEKAEMLLQDGIRAQEAAGKSEQEAYRSALAKPLEIITSHPVTKPESLGPFVLRQWQKGAYIHLARNENFFARDKEMAGQRVGPFVDGIIFKIYGNTDTAVLALKKGDIDYLWWGIESGYLEDLRNNPNVRIFSTLKSGYRYLGFNLRRPPMSDPVFRKAVAFLVDKDFVIQRILHNQACRLDTVIQPDNVHYCLQRPPLYGKGMSWRERVEKAKELLKEAGYTWETEPVGGDFPGQFSRVGRGMRLPNGQPAGPLNLLTPPADYDAQRAQTGNLIQQWLRDFGVPVNWRPMAFSAMTKKVESERDFDLFVSGWGALGQDPDYLRSFFHSAADVPDGKNPCGYRNPRFDELADRQAATMDPTERREIVMRMQEILMEDLPYVPLYVPVNLEAVRADRFHGWREMPGGIGNLWSFLLVRPVKK